MFMHISLIVTSSYSVQAMYTLIYSCCINTANCVLMVNWPKNILAAVTMTLSVVMVGYYIEQFVFYILPRTRNSTANTIHSNSYTYKLYAINSSRSNTTHHITITYITVMSSSIITLRRFVLCHILYFFISKQCLCTIPLFYHTRKSGYPPACFLQKIHGLVCSTAAITMLLTIQN